MSGTFDNNDTPLSGWTVNLTNSSGLVGSVVTNASGLFRFSNLTPGNYTLSEVVQSGYVNTSAKTLNVTLQPNQTLNVTNTFRSLRQRPAACHDRRDQIPDPNMNGTYDPGASSVTRWGSMAAQTGRSILCLVSVRNRLASYTWQIRIMIGFRSSIRVAASSLPGARRAAQTDHSVIRLGSVRIRPASYTWQTPAIIVSRSLIRVAVLSWLGLCAPAAQTDHSMIRLGSVGIRPASYTWQIRIIIGSRSSIRVAASSLPGAHTAAQTDHSNIRLVSVWDPSGFIYVADSGNNRIEKFDSSGGFVTTWVVGQRKRIIQLSVWCLFNSSGFIYVADTYNDRIEKFSSSGGFVTAWGSSGSANGSFDLPSGVCSDPSGCHIRGRH